MIPQGEPLADARHRVTPPGPAEIGERIRLLALVALTVVLIGLCVLLAVPFLPAITWAVALAILAWPMHRWITRRVARRGLAAALSTAVVGAVILATGLFVTYQIASEAVSAAERVKDGAAGGDIREKVAAMPGLGRAVAWMERVGLDVGGGGPQARRVEHPADLRPRPGVGDGRHPVPAGDVHPLLPVPRPRRVPGRGPRPAAAVEAARATSSSARAADSVHATLYATVVTSLIDATAFGLAFWAVGLPAPVLWAVIMFVLSLLPVLGAGLVWVPAAAYLAMTGRWLGAAALVGWGC